MNQEGYVKTMRTIGIVAVMFAIGGLSSGCLGVAAPALGFVYSDVQWDGDAEGSLGAKEGKACATSYFGVVSIGDASIKAAAKDGGIKTVTRVDHHTKWTVVIGEYCTIVGGN